ncbi:MAG: hypothetical protein AB1679_01575 [Actinomycetota bacterium]|jgi:hypothetical protein
MSDARAALSEGFNERLGVLLERHDKLLSDLAYEAAKALGAQGADAAVAPLIWAAAVGDRWATSTVTEFLHVTRQALHKRLVKGTILGLPGTGTTWFPTWQFDVDARQVRPMVAELIAAFRDELGSVDPFLVASWATTPQPELGMSPEDWLASGKDPDEVVRVARRAAAELSR